VILVHYKTVVAFVLYSVIQSVIIHYKTLKVVHLDAYLAYARSLFMSIVHSLPV